MSRALFVALAEDEVVARCNAEKVSISAIETLKAGGVRLVCSSTYGAEQMTRKFKSKLIPADQVSRERHRPTTPLW